MGEYVGPATLIDAHGEHAVEALLSSSASGWGGTLRSAEVDWFELWDRRELVTLHIGTREGQVLVTPKDALDVEATGESSVSGSGLPPFD